jgi:antitoxin HigA-1
MTRMHNPPHPGEVLQDTVLRSDGGLSVTQFAKRLGMSRVALSRVVNARAAVSAELAIRLAAALGGSAESWLRMQVAYDLWHTQKKRRPRIQRLPGYKSSKGPLPQTTN